MIEVLDLRNVNWGSAGTIKACFSIKFTILLPNNQLNLIFAGEQYMMILKFQILQQLLIIFLYV